MARSRPLAIGLLGSVNRFDERARRQARVQLFLAAEAQGYVLVETFELGHSALRADSAFRAAEVLARQIEPAAVVYAELIDHKRLQSFATSMGMIVLGPSQAADNNRPSASSVASSASRQHVSVSREAKPQLPQAANEIRVLDGYSRPTNGHSRLESHS